MRSTPPSYYSEVGRDRACPHQTQVMQSYGSNPSYLPQLCFESSSPKSWHQTPSSFKASKLTPSSNQRIPAWSIEGTQDISHKIRLCSTSSTLDFSILVFISSPKKSNCFQRTIISTYVVGSLNRERRSLTILQKKGLTVAPLPLFSYLLAQRKCEDCREKCPLERKSCSTGRF